MDIEEKKTDDIGESLCDEEIFEELKVENEDRPYESAIKSCIVEIVNTADWLSPQEKQALIFHHGLEGGIPHTLRETAEKFGISFDRLKFIERRIERRVMRMMYRSRSRSKMLKDFLD